MQGILRRERGSTRLAVVIAATVLIALVAAAAPMVLGQSHRAQDTRAQNDLKRLVAQVERCRLAAPSYTNCDEQSELEGDDGVTWGRGAGQAGMLASRSQTRAFTAYAVSASGQRVYVLTHDVARVSRRVCRHGSVPRLERDGCDEPGW